MIAWSITGVGMLMLAFVFQTLSSQARVGLRHLRLREIGTRTAFPPAIVAHAATRQRRERIGMLMRQMIHGSPSVFLTCFFQNIDLCFFRARSIAFSRPSASRPQAGNTYPHIL